MFNTNSAEAIRFGAFDPLVPNGIISAAGEENLFGLRILIRDTETGKLCDGRKSFVYSDVRIGPMYGDRFYRIQWTWEGKRVEFVWGRTDERNVWGHVEAEKGLTILPELYIPRMYRLKYSWANFTAQSPRILTGEMIAPWGSADQPIRAMRLIFSRKPEKQQGYVDRNRQIQAYAGDGSLNNLAQGNIWNDMGISWQYAAEFTDSVDFLYSLDEPAAFLDLPSDDESDRLLAAGKNTVLAFAEEQKSVRLTGEGALFGIPDAIQSPIYYNLMYREDTGRRYVITERTWERNDDDWGIMFKWDTFLSSLPLNWFDTELARENILAELDNQLPDGHIPQRTFRLIDPHAEPPITAGRSQHIVQAYTVWQTYLWTRDKNWLSGCYDKLRRAHLWWFADRGDGQAYRDALGWGLLGFGYDPEKEMGILGARVQPYVGKAQYAYFETYDDSPQWTNGTFFKTVGGMYDITEDDVTDLAKYVDAAHTADMYTLERCCLFAVDAECLAKMAEVLGKEEDRLRFTAEYERMKELVNEKMWDEEDGCYYNLRFDRTLAKVRTPDCFIPFMAGFVSEERADRLMKHLLAGNDFWGEYKMPSVARSDPAYPDQQYWRGQIWPPLVLWTHIGLRRIGRLAEAWELASSSSKMLLREWTERNFYPENYNGDTGRCSGAQHYNWGTLMGTVALDEMVELREDCVIFGRTAAPAGTGLRGIRLDGHRYDVQKTETGIRVCCDGNVIAESADPVVLQRESR